MSNLSKVLLSVFIIGLSGTFAPVFDPGGSGGGANLTVKEADNDPSVSNVSTISLTNGTLTDDGGGQVSITISGTGAPTDATYILQVPDAGLTDGQALSALSTGCMGSATTTGVVSTRTITGTANQISVANGDCSGNPTLSIPTNPTLPGTTTGTFSGNLTGDVTGNVSGTAGSLAANGANCSAGSAPLGVDASGAVESCTDYAEEPAGNGILAKTAANTITNRTITGTANEIAVANGDGVAGNPTISLPATINLSAKTLRIPNGTVLPGTCTTGDQFMDTDATSGQRHYLCESTDTWALQGDGGGGGAGTVTSVDASGGVETVSGSAITTTGTIRGSTLVTYEAGTTYTVLTTDRGSVIVFTGSSPVAVTLPAIDSNFPEGFYVYFQVKGTGDVTVTPDTVTIDGAASITLSQNDGVMVISDGGNYTTVRGMTQFVEAQGLQDVFAISKEITGANSEANCFKVGDGTNKACFFWDATDGFRITTDPIGDLVHWIPTNQNYVLHDEEDDSAVVTIDPDAGGTGVASVAYRAGTTFTGVTLDEEGSNNSITRVMEIVFPLAGCVGGSAFSNLNDDATGATGPTAACNDTGSIQDPSLDFAGGAVNSAQLPKFRLPTGWTGNIDFTLRYVTTAGSPSGNVEWDISTVCRATGESWDSAFNSAQTITDAVGSQNQANDATQTSLTTTGCAAGEDLTIKISRDGTNDTNNDTAKATEVIVTLRATK